MAKIEIHKSADTTTIDNDTGEVTVRRDRSGVVKGFGEGLREYVMKGKSVSVQVGADVRVGQLPAGHAEAGKFAVQVNFLSFDDNASAGEFADRISAVIEGYLGANAVKVQ